ncbi:alkylation response protein AidB-like acyl-CoA dehydrogenase [Nocardia transvalensis]|uniref:Alkylation response protein AidB-like acyl-CoA dehydrogenase n=1 Tax=Nocardia transvalensis TaxID=37333 RepID=A0A7W9PGC2_9NOCA|nr:acyl-CoA dehydrogenase family protein [Nocardia transvalensis]MBB5915560.1 alkylation response protein AidB-like acyl-CoA dehydrogenase [Nocardia transvalensis]
MTGEYDDLHDDLRTVARGVLAKTDHETPVDWSDITRSGWLGLEAPVEIDGAGATFAELAVILEEIGRSASYTAFPSVATLSIAALNLLAPNPARDKVFHATVAGEALPVLVLPGEWSASPAAFTLATDSTTLRLTGSASFVLDAPAADHLLIPARTPDGETVIVPMDPATPGITITNQPVVDTTRIFGHITTGDLPVPPESLWHFTSTAPLRHLHTRAAISLACDSLGLAEAMLSATIEYTRTRTQFARPIGSFQAVQHACADMHVHTRVARHLVTAAVQAETTASDSAPTAASMAKSYATTAAVEITGKALQLHGGVGYTWESGLHTYLKRATLNRTLYGAPAAHRRLLTARYT